MHAHVQKHLTILERVSAWLHAHVPKHLMIQQVKLIAPHRRDLRLATLINTIAADLVRRHVLPHA